jgi:hypothetical protein
MLKAATELSFILKKDTRSYDEEDETVSSDLWMLYDNAINEIKSKVKQSLYLSSIFKKHDVKFFQDQASIEVNHREANYIDDNLYSHIYTLMKTCGLVPQYNFIRKGVKYFTPTGGGHVHVEVPFAIFSREKFFSDFEIFETSLINAVSNRPYLLWLFAEPFDTHMYNFSSGANGYKQVEIRDLVATHPFVPRYRSVRHKRILPTIEFRMIGNAPPTDAAAYRNFGIFSSLVEHYSYNKEHFTLTEKRYKQFMRSPNMVFDDFAKLLKTIRYSPDKLCLKDLSDNYMARKDFKNFR